MANSYVHFSTFIPCSKTVAKKLIRLLEKAADNDVPLPTHWQLEESGVWLAGDYGLDDSVEHILCMWQTKNGVPPFGIEFAWTCDSPRIGEFGGSAIVFINGTVTGFSTNDWVRKQLVPR